ncbi:MAG: toprim domain-containing protein [Acetobacter sp.]|nr:toprim domain-containing protein [Bacteroides sp.]MCM1341421.1 toprim domain-containing protein [Acetobacter sp.]MCM1433375.1 toprim domain-containing protein [Clostridiales bacterium]
MAKKKEYGNESIKSLKGADRVRLRPAVIFGSDGLEGCQHAVFEIMSNSIDEAREGFGNKIVITRFLDGSIEVQDFGRGIPVDYNKNEECYNWELLFCEMYAGGKYDNGGDNYEYSLGLNGLGLCATQYASEYMDAEIHTGGYKYTLHFEKGENIGGLKKEKYDKKDTGTRIRWKPDLDVFTDINIPLEYYKETIRRQAIVNDGVKFILKDQQNASKFETTEFCYSEGIMDYVKELSADKAFTTAQYWECERKGKDRDDLPEYKLKIKSALCFSLKTQTKEYYHNSSFLEHGGAPEKAFKSAFVSQVNAYLKANGKYSKSDGMINIQDIEDCIIFVVSSFSTQTSYENQTKKAITNKFIQEAMTDFFRKQLEVYFIENKMDADKIANQVLINMRARVKAENTRKTLKTSLQSKMDMTNRIQKFVDCRSKDVNEREVFIVEGDSALGACKQARDAAFQAIIPVRGKILNCLKADYDKIFKSEIITDLIKVLGCGVEVKSKAAKDLSMFDMDNLRWSKVLICTDADVDGFQIRTLILTMIYRLMPKLIEAGKVYIAESPLYEVTCGDQTYFAYNEIEMDEIKAEIGSKKFTVQRSKGLGENEAEMMALTTMNPATRRLIQVTPDDAKETSEIFDLLLGDNLDGRKEYIADYGHLYLDAADVS